MGSSGFTLTFDSPLPSSGRVEHQFTSEWKDYNLTNECKCHLQDTFGLCRLCYIERIFVCHKPAYSVLITLLCNAHVDTPRISQ